MSSTSTAAAVAETPQRLRGRDAVQQYIGKKMSGAEIFLHALEAEDARVVFGHPGGAVIHVYDEMARVQPNFEHVLVRHEQGGTHAAEGYAKATGQVGTVLVTSGPGATNTVTGIADAFMDSVPIVVFTGQVPMPLIGNDAFQETDTLGVTRSITKHNYLVRSPDDIPRIVHEAYHLARTGRPGPVVVDLPKDVLMAEGVFQFDEEIHMRGYSVPDECDEIRLRRAVRMIEKSQRPLLYVGGGTINSNAAGVLTEFARHMNIPVTTSLHGLGAFPEDDPLSLGMLGMHGMWWANQAVQHADLIIAVGARFDDRVTGMVDRWAPHAAVIHIEIDKSCISKNIYADLAFNADVKAVLERLRPLVKPKKVKRWLNKIQDWRDECPLTYADDGELRPQYVLERLRAKSGGDAVVCTDVGQNQMWAAQYLKYTQPRSHITSGGLGTMGFSLPAALGAGFGMRAYGIGKTVISINGDGGFMMNAQELAVASAHKIPLKVVIMNNNFLGMVRQWQELFHENRFSHTDLTDTNPDFVQLARASRCAALRAESPDQVDEVIEKAWEINDRPVVMEFRVVKEEMVFPMVPAGKSSDEMITSRHAPETFV